MYIYMHMHPVWRPVPTAAQMSDAVTAGVDALAR